MKFVELLFGWFPVPERIVSLGIDYIPLYLDEKGIWIDKEKYENALIAYSQEAFNRASNNSKFTTWKKYFTELDDVSEAIYQFVKYKRTKDARIEMISQFYNLDPQKGDIVCFVRRAR